MSIIDDYLESLDPEVQAELCRIRTIAKSLLPECEEVLAYGMPTLKYQGKNIIGFDVHKNHIGIYPFSGHVISEIKELENYKTSKGAVQEKLDAPMPSLLIKKIVKERLRQAGF